MASQPVEDHRGHMRRLGKHPPPSFLLPRVADPPVGRATDHVSATEPFEVRVAGAYPFGGSAPKDRANAVDSSVDSGLDLVETCTDMATSDVPKRKGKSASWLVCTEVIAVLLKNHKDGKMVPTVDEFLDEFKSMRQAIRDRASALECIQLKDPERLVKTPAVYHILLLKLFSLQDQILMTGFGDDDVQLTCELKRIWNQLEDHLNNMPDHETGKAHTKVKNQLKNQRQRFHKVQKTQCKPGEGTRVPASTGSTPSAWCSAYSLSLN